MTGREAFDFSKPLWLTGISIDPLEVLLGVFKAVQLAESRVQDPVMRVLTDVTLPTSSRNMLESKAHNLLESEARSNLIVIIRRKKLSRRVNIQKSWIEMKE